MNKLLLLTSNHSKEMAAKVPEITLYFWITKLLTTGMGEVASDFLFERLNPFISAPLSVLIFAASDDYAVQSTPICSLDLLVSCRYGQYIWHNGCRCCACWTGHSLYGFNTLFYGIPCCYPSNLVFHREDAVCSQYLHPAS